MTSKLQSYLVYVLDDQPRQVVIWDVIEITLGRLPTQDIQIPDEEVSRQHAVLRKEGDSFSVEDLKTGLGTQVNGEEIRGRREIRPGDQIQIGPLKLQLAQTEDQIARGPNVRFGSQLKGFALPDGGDDGGRTMLGLAPEDILADTSPVPPPAEPAGPVALSASGALEASDVRDLDDLFDEDEPGDIGIAGAPVDEAPVDLEPQSAEAPVVASATLPPVSSQGNARVRVALDIEGPAHRIQAILAALAGKDIQVPPLKLRVHLPNRD